MGLTLQWRAEHAGSDKDVGEQDAGSTVPVAFDMISLNDESGAGRELVGRVVSKAVEIDPYGGRLIEGHG